MPLRLPINNKEAEQCSIEPYLDALHPEQRQRPEEMLKPVL